jgi:Fur family peroxide stress response transcriptional regulator
MEKREKLIMQLRERGFKITPQRLAIIDILEEIKHPSAEEIYKMLLPDYPMLSMATVYNTLEVLKELGEITKIGIKPNVALYDANPKPHHHFLCRLCGEVFDIAVKTPLDAGKKLKGHKIEQVKVYLYGVCAKCLKGV